MKLLFMLEDEHDRIRRFAAIISRHHPAAQIVNSRTAPDFIAAWQQLDATPDLICLDHDLFTDTPEEPDPGDGRDVSHFLCAQPPLCPALIHSTNSIAAESMLYSMRDAGWTVQRLLPIGEHWIEEDWYPMALDAVHRSVRHPVSKATSKQRATPTNVLFVCSMNRWRSPTAEKIYAQHEHIIARSKGTSRKARQTISADDIRWADVIFVMERKHEQQLRTRFPGETASATIHVLDIPDDYQFMDPELIHCIETAVEEFFRG